MNSKLLQSHYAGFRLDDTLATRITWQGIIWVQDKEPIIRNPQSKQEFMYWSIKDENGAKFSCFDDMLAETIHIGERYEMSGEVKIAKGGTFLNVKKANLFTGRNYKEKIQ